MAEVRFEQATRIYPGNDAPARRRARPGDRRRRADGARRPVGLGQDDGAADARGARGGRRRRRLHRRPRRDRRRAEAPRRRDGLPELRALPVPRRSRPTSRFPLRMARVPKAERERARARGRRAARAQPYLERKPGQLSGGQRQRVAMGRAIIRQPRVFLMDEPLSNLDAQLRVQMRADIAALQSRLGVTTVFVTHDQAEAMTLGHRVAVLKDARLQQCDTPRALFDRPVNTFVAGFIGSPAMNLCTLPLADGATSTFGGRRSRSRRAQRPRRRDRRRAAGGARARRRRRRRRASRSSRSSAPTRTSSARAELRGGRDAAGRARRRPPRARARRRACACGRARSTTPHVFDADYRRAVGACAPTRDTARCCATSTSARSWRRSAPARRSRVPRSPAASGSPSRRCRWRWRRCSRRVWCGRPTPTSKARRTARRSSSPYTRPRWCSGSTSARASCAARSATCAGRCGRARTSSCRGPTWDAVLDAAAELRYRLLAAGDLAGGGARRRGRRRPGRGRDAERAGRARQQHPGLEGLRIGPALEERLGLPVTVDNDVNLAAIGEQWRGIAQGVRRLRVPVGRHRARRRARAARRAAPRPPRRRRRGRLRARR